MNSRDDEIVGRDCVPSNSLCIFSGPIFSLHLLVVVPNLTVNLSLLVTFLFLLLFSPNNCLPEVVVVYSLTHSGMGLVPLRNTTSSAE